MENQNTKKIIVKDGLGHIDTFLTNMYLPTIDFWNSIRFTPNMLTTLGLISSSLCLYYFYHKKPLHSIIFLILRCYFDYADGLLARKYSLVSKFGDKYDHFVDLSFGIGFFVIIFLKSNDRKYLLPILGLFYFLFTVHMGCVENEYSKSNDLHADEETTISYLKKLCFKPKLMRYFDNGTLYIVMSIIVLYISKEEVIKPLIKLNNPTIDIN